MYLEVELFARAHSWGDSSFRNLPARGRDPWHSLALPRRVCCCRRAATQRYCQQWELMDGSGWSTKKTVDSATVRAAAATPTCLAHSLAARLSLAYCALAHSMFQGADSTCHSPGGWAGGCPVSCQCDRRSDSQGSPCEQAHVKQPVRGLCEQQRPDSGQRQAVWLHAI